MTRIRILLVAAILATAGAAVADGVRCVFHTYAACYFTGETNMGARKYRCTCGDEIWVRAR